MSKHPYDLVKPCSDCPFRKKPFFDLRAARVQEIEDADGEFHCHKTVEYDDEDGEPCPGSPNQKVCAGWLIVHRNQDTANQMIRIAERLGMLNVEDLSDEVDCYASFEEYIEEIQYRERKRKQ